MGGGIALNIFVLAAKLGKGAQSLIPAQRELFCSEGSCFSMQSPPTSLGWPVVFWSEKDVSERKGTGGRFPLKKEKKLRFSSSNVTCYSTNCWERPLPQVGGRERKREIPKEGLRTTRGALKKKLRFNVERDCRTGHFRSAHEKE